ncbi:MAG: amino acid ABC transporter permease [Eubacterium sp.]|nr:amino acid ABC transporter permease [Eubacterium sp.]
MTYAAFPTDGGFWEWVVYLIMEYKEVFLRGAFWTLAIAVVGTIIGCIIGFIVGIIQTIELEANCNYAKRAAIGLLKAVTRLYVEIFRGTPMIVQAMVIYYGLSYLGIQWDALPCGFLVVSINTGAYMAESVRGGVGSVSPGQFEAGKVIGLSHIQIMFHIVLPQALKNIMPQIGNQLVTNLKDTSVLNVISVNELFFSGKTAASVYYKYFEVFLIVAAIYFVLNLIVTFILHRIEKLLEGKADYQLSE